MWSRNLVRFLLPVACLGCSAPAPPPSVVAPDFTITDALAPNLLSVGRGQALLTALRETESGHEFVLAPVEDPSESPSVIAEGTDFFANWADVPGMVQAGDGSLIAHWLERSGPQTYDYGVRVARSVDQGATWTRLGWLNDDAWGVDDRDTIAGEHGFVAWVPEGEGARAFWLDGREMSGGHGGMVGAMQLRTTTVIDGEITPSEVLDERVCDCCPNAAVNTLAGPLVAFRDRTEDEIRDVHLMRRTDEGWVRTVIDTSGWKIPGCPVNGPALAAEGDLALAAWYTAHPEPRVYAAWSLDAGASFGEPMLLTTDTLGRITAAILDGRGYVAWLAAVGSAADAAVSPGEVRMVGLDPDGTLSPGQVVATTAASRRAGIPRLTVDGGGLGLAWTAVEVGAEGEIRTDVHYRPAYRDSTELRVD